MGSDRLVIERFCYADVGTFGKTNVAGYEVYTCEAPWLNNERARSCIPEGTYTCSPDWYHRGGYACIGIEGPALDGRKRILFHKGNWPSDVRGCIAVGFDWCPVVGRIGVPKSKEAFALLMEHWGGRRFELEITRRSAGRVAA